MTLYAPPRENLKLSDCDFYHVMDLPGIGQVGGQWDLRDCVDQYLGNFDFEGKRVLEIGPASGFLTIEMERRGAKVVAVEVLDDPGWDFVPFPASVLTPHMQSRRNHMTRIKNSWWFVHRVHRSLSLIHYGDAYALPDLLGEFDVAVMASVLTHVKSPVGIMEQCAKRAKALIVSEAHRPDLDGRPLCILSPTKENKDWGTWWHFSKDFFRNFLEVMGYEIQDTTLYSPKYHGTPVPLFTVVGKRK